MHSNVTILPLVALTTLDPIPPSDTFRCGSVIMGLTSMICLLHVLATARCEYSADTGTRVAAWMGADLVALCANLVTVDGISMPVDPPWPEMRTVKISVNASWEYDQPQVLVARAAGLDLISWASGAFLLLHVWTYWFFLGLAGAQIPAFPCPGRRSYPLAGLLCLVALMLHFMLGPQYTRLSYINK